MLRPYGPDDADSLISIWRAASALAHPFLSDAFLAEEEEAIRTLHLPRAVTWVMEQEGRPVGFIALMGNEIGGLFLDPAFHGRGLGRAMVEHGVARHGPLQVEVFEKNTLGRRFYERCGFHETGFVLHEPTGETIVQMAQGET